MLKKILIAVFMTTLFITQNVSAQDVLVYEADGYSYYVVTETFENKTVYRDNRAFEVAVKIFYLENLREELPFNFWENDGIIWFNNGEGTGMHPVDGFKSAENIWNFGLKFLNLDYEVSYK